MLLILVILLSAIGDAGRYLFAVSAITLIGWGALLMVHVRYQDNENKSFDFSWELAISPEHIVSVKGNG